MIKCFYLSPISSDASIAEPHIKQLSTGFIGFHLSLYFPIIGRGLEGPFKRSSKFDGSSINMGGEGNG